MPDDLTFAPRDHRAFKALWASNLSEIAELVADTPGRWAVYFDEQERLALLLVLEDHQVRGWLVYPAPDMAGALTLMQSFAPAIERAAGRELKAAEAGALEAIGRATKH